MCPSWPPSPSQVQPRYFADLKFSFFYVFPCFFNIQCWREPKLCAYHSEASQAALVALFQTTLFLGQSVTCYINFTISFPPSPCKKRTKGPSRKRHENMSSSTRCLLHCGSLLGSALALFVWKLSHPQAHLATNVTKTKTNQPWFVGRLVGSSSASLSIWNHKSANIGSPKNALKQSPDHNNRNPLIHIRFYTYR